MYKKFVTECTPAFMRKYRSSLLRYLFIYFMAFILIILSFLMIRRDSLLDIIAGTILMILMIIVDLVSIYYIYNRYQFLSYFKKICQKPESELDNDITNILLIIQEYRNKKLPNSSIQSNNDTNIGTDQAITITLPLEYLIQETSLSKWVVFIYCNLILSQSLYDVKEEFYTG